MLTNFFRKNRSKNRSQNIRDSFGQPILKDRNINSIKIFHDINNAEIRLVDNKTWDDLEMDKVFKFIDRTNSKTGEQYLYNLLHTKQNKEKQERLNKKVNYYRDNFEKVLINSILLKKYDSITSYTLPTLLQGKQIYRTPVWAVLLGFIAILLGVLFLLYKPLLIPFIVIGLINTLLHYYFKPRINIYYHDLINIKSFYNLYSKLIKQDNEIGVLSSSEKKKLRTIFKRCSYLTMNIEYADELTAALYYILEIIKGWFLLDVILFNNTMKLIKQNSQLLQKVYGYVGLVDSAISIASVKQGVQGCVPTYTSEQELIIKNAYHPLIEKCINNSISLKTKNSIITGGNMSGKTTFLKTIGINIILSQTINYSLSDEIILPDLCVLSAITNEDDLQNGKSFFMNELLRAKQILETVESSNTIHLILFDEIFKGTNSKDRITLASSILVHLSKFKCFVIVTTHDLDIIEFVKETYETSYFDNSFIKDQIIFDYKIRKGIQNKTNVLALIKSLNFSDQIISDTIKYGKIFMKKL